MQNPADYTKELADIAKELAAVANALNRPSISPWVIAMVSSLIGFISAFLLQVLNAGREERKQSEALRRDLYKELETNYLNLRFLLVNAPPGMASDALWNWRYQQAKRTLPFKAEEHANSKRDVYVALPEYQAFEEIYILLHLACDSSIEEFKNLAFISISKIHDLVEQDAIKRKYTKKFMGAEWHKQIGKQLTFDFRAAASKP